jgi:RNA polymerase subunit RPABC4/transcription elongation factor Spt4
MRNVNVDAAVGAHELEDCDVPMCGPEKAVKAHCDVVVSIKPGHTKKSDIAKQINRKFADEGFDVDLDYIIRSLPPGESQIA